MPAPWEDGAILSMHARSTHLRNAAGTAASPGDAVETAINPGGGLNFTAGNTPARRPTFDTSGNWLLIDGQAGQFLQALDTSPISATPYTNIISVALRIRAWELATFRCLVDIGNSIQLWAGYDSTLVALVDGSPIYDASLGAQWNTVIASCNSITGVGRLRVNNATYAGSPQFPGTFARRWNQPRIGNYAGLASFAARFDLAAAAFYHSDRVDDPGVKSWFDTAETEPAGGLLLKRRKAAAA